MLLHILPHASTKGVVTCTYMPDVRHDARRRVLLTWHGVAPCPTSVVLLVLPWHSRSLGDSIGESVGVFAEPEQLVLNVSKNDKFVVIASDGVFEFITSHKVWCASRHHGEGRVFRRWWNNQCVSLEKGALRSLENVSFEQAATISSNGRC